MKNLSKLSLLFLTLVYFGTDAASQSASVVSAEVVPNHSTHIARITKDSIIVITGTTYSFTVDTPEDSGLVLTNTTVGQLISEINSKDGSDQQYFITDKDGVTKREGRLQPGNKLIVTSQNGKTKKSYNIGLELLAIRGQLDLDKKKLTVNTNSDLVLYFTAGQRTPDATVKIYVPKCIPITGENTMVNVNGRGAVKLKDLGTQSIGRVGSSYSYHKVGNFEITKSRMEDHIFCLRNLTCGPLTVRTSSLQSRMLS